MSRVFNRRSRPGWPLMLGLALAAACGEASTGGAGAPTGPAQSAGSVPSADMAGVDLDIVRAVDEARARVLASPDSSEAWGGLGDRFAVHQFVRAAAPCYARAEELDPEEKLWPYRLGWALFNDEPEQALAAFQRVLARLDDYAPMHESYAQTLFRLGRTDEARKHFARASELDPGFAQPETGLGQIALLAGDFEVARGHFEEALQRDSDHTEAHIGLAQVFHALGRPDDARAHADRSRELPQVSPRRDFLGNPVVAPAGARARADEARSLEREKKFDEAIAIYRIAIAADPHYYVARKRLAMLFNRRGRKAEAEALLLEGLELDPGAPAILADLEKVRAPD